MTSEKNINDIVNIISKVLYINLDQRKDRNEHCINQLKMMNFDNYERISAVFNNIGAIGCSHSHILALEKAKIENLDNVLICEDDILFTNTKLLKEQLQYLFTNNIKFDVFMLAVNVKKHIIINEYICKVKQGQTMGAYIVNKHYYDTLLNNLKEGIKLFEQGIHTPCDKYIKKLQMNDNWLCFSKLSVTQLPNFSNNENSFRNYNNLLLRKLI